MKGENHVEDGYYWGYRKGGPEAVPIYVYEGKVYEFGVDDSEDLWEMKWRVGEKITQPDF